MSSDTSHTTPLLLDTHVWVWLLAGDTARLDANIPVRVENAGEAGHCFVSDISAWEVATKSVRRALTLSMDVNAWLGEAARAPGLRAIGVSRELLVATTRLPLDTLPDFADRVLVVTAQQFGLTLVTCDAALLSFADHWPFFQVLDARL